MSLVEAAYQQAIDSMSPAQKIERMVNLNAWGRSVIARKIIAESGPLPPEVLKLRVALWIYGGEPHVRGLIEEALRRVSR